MRSFWNTKKGVTPIDEWQPGCWVQITCPVEDDVRFLVDELHMPDYFITDVADADERARYDMDEGWLMIILRIPHLKSVSSRTPYTTIPLGVVLKGDVIITICDQEARMMVDFVNHQQRRAATCRGLFGCCRPRVPSLPFCFRVVSEVSEAGERSHREGKAQPRWTDR